MTDEHVPSDDTSPDLAATPAAPDETVETHETPRSPKTSAFGRSRQLLAAGAAGLLLVGGLVGFGIGRATGGDDGPRFARMGQFGPGQHGFGRHGNHRWHGNFGDKGQRGPGFGRGQVPRGPSDDQPGGQPPQPTPSPSSTSS